MHNNNIKYDKSLAFDFLCILRSISNDHDNYLWFCPTVFTMWNVQTTNTSVKKTSKLLYTYVLSWLYTVIYYIFIFKFISRNRNIYFFFLTDLLQYF
jgi:hypothetical protein